MSVDFGAAIKKELCRAPFLLFLIPFEGCLQGDYILCLRTFLAISDSELDFLAV